MPSPRIQELSSSHWEGNADRSLLTVVQTIVNLADYKMSLRDAIEFPRIHHQYLPDRADAEPAAIVREVAETKKLWPYDRS